MIHPVVINPVINPVVRITDPVAWRAGKAGFPSGAILHFDANTDPYTEQTGGPHTFNYAILAPQYQRQSDGASLDVGAKVAADFCCGERWVRSCGVITNLFGGDTSIARSVTLTAQSYTLQVFGAGTATCSYGTATVSTPLTFTATAGATTFTPTGATRWMLTATAYPVPYVPPGVTQPASNATTTNGVWFALPDGSPLWQGLDGKADGVELVDLTSAIVHNYDGSMGSYDGKTKTLSNTVIGTNQSFPRFGFEMGAKTVGARYRCSFVFSDTAKLHTIRLAINGSTQNLTKTGNVFSGTITADNTYNKAEIQLDGRFIFSTQIISATIQRIQPQPLTLATRVRMGVGSGDVLSAAYLGIVAEKATEDTVIQRSLKNVDGNTNIVMAKDGTNGASNGYNVPWPRNAIIRRITQVSADGTQYRVGYMIEGTNTAIQWGLWVAYDGSFGPSTLYRLMLGYNNAYPMWFSRITAWKEQVSDDRILEALNG